MDMYSPRATEQIDSTGLADTVTPVVCYNSWIGWRKEWRMMEGWSVER
jgi:hypothetical protein